MAGRALTILAVFVICGAALGVYLIRDAPTIADEELAARAVVEQFGAQLKNVSLLGEAGAVVAEMDRAYGPYVRQQLLQKWKDDPESAPGRLTSSPWPDRIEIQNVQHEAGPRFVFEGAIVEVSNEGSGINETPAEASRRPVVVAVEREGSAWKITMVKLGAYPGDGQWILSEPDTRGVQFMYPEQLATTFISVSEPDGWPPTVTLAAGDYSCAEEQQQMLGDREHCVVETTEGAAGTMYRTFEYTTAQGDFIARATFTLRYPQCANYPEPQSAACQSEQRSFDVNGLADRILSSIRML